MKFFAPALSILSLGALLAACDTLGLPDITKEDQVPDTVKTQPWVIETPPPVPADATAPPLGGVPFMPKDFSPTAVSDHYMNELEYDRSESIVAKKKVENEGLVPPADLSAPTPSASGAGLVAPQFKP